MQFSSRQPRFVSSRHHRLSPRKAAMVVVRHGATRKVLQVQSPGLGCLCLSLQVHMSCTADAVTDPSRIESCPRKAWQNSRLRE